MINKLWNREVTSIHEKEARRNKKYRTSACLAGLYEYILHKQSISMGPVGTKFCKYLLSIQQLLDLNDGSRCLRFAVIFGFRVEWHHEACRKLKCKERSGLHLVAFRMVQWKKRWKALVGFTMKIDWGSRDHDSVVEAKSGRIRVNQ